MLSQWLNIENIKTRPKISFRGEAVNLHEGIQSAKIHQVP